MADTAVEVRTVDVITAAIEKATKARDKAKGAAKGKLTRELKKLDAELVEAQKPVEPEPEVTLEQLEALVVTELLESGSEPTFDAIGAIGNPIVKADRLKFYKAQRWGNGEWISKAVLKRIKAAVKLGSPVDVEAPQTEPATEPADLMADLEASLEAQNAA